LNLIDQQKIRIGSCAWSFDDWLSRNRR